MKIYSKITFLSLLFVIVFAGIANAQHDRGMKCPMYKHGNHHCDSTEVHHWDSTDLDFFTYCFHDFHMDDFPFFKEKMKYNGHWAGVEIGINGYETSEFNMNFYPDYPYMNMNTGRSVFVNLNPFELNVNLFKNHIGFTTGLGFQLSNYYFTNNYVMLKDSAMLVAYQSKDQLGNSVNFKVNKLFISYLNLPLFFEYQTNRYRRMNSFHVTLGVIVGVRLCTYTKQDYSSIDQTYTLVDDNGNKVATYYVDKRNVRTSGAYHLNPFKVDAAFRIGWSHLNLFATYSITPMFQKNQGPELYPWTVGITLLGW
ncbi:MAG: outer membrane beta-barrel protein [Bacteroidales bacterium]|nr:outer membrane beta-barrel protein [Bacteroidales bacterium]